jgi:hypothetical protein
MREGTHRTIQHIRSRPTMNDQLPSTEGVFSNLSCQEKRRHLAVLSDVVWDIETQLAQAKEARAELMSSLQSDIRSASMIR